MTLPASDWERAARVLQILAISGTGLGGAVLRMRAGPARDRILTAIRQAFPNAAKLHPNVDDTHLFGGVDIASTLSQGHIVKTRGLLDRAETLLLTMAERCPDDLAAKLSQHLDRTPEATLFALDEGADEAECTPTSLTERLAFLIAPEGTPPPDWGIALPDAGADHARHSDSDIDALVLAAEQFGITSLRAPLFALAAARANATLEGRAEVSEEDLSVAAALIYAHRATRMPPEDSDQQDDLPQPEQPEPQEPDTSEGEDKTQALPQGEMLIAAIKALLPPEVLAGLGQMGRPRGAHGAGAGQKRKGNRRGRPLPSRWGKLDGRARLDVVATLRAAAPWQPIRRKLSPDRMGLLIRSADLRLKRYETKSDRLIVFAVDASGSAAISRLNEAKGAIELLLGQAYAARDHVALVSFRGEGAECLLAPTRSLVQTKRKLAALPGGGGTPLAAGMQEALHIAGQAHDRGLSPVIILATDGKANIALDGTADRAKAREDATRMAAHLRAAGHEILVIDTSNRPQPTLRDLAQHLDARYLPLPRANAERLSAAVQTALDDA